MGFSFNTMYDQDNAFCFNGLIKNNGFFKSAKQRDFLLGRVSQDQDDSAHVIMGTYRGITVESGQRVFDVCGTMTWADYGRKSHRRCEQSYVFDQHGVVAKYKLHFVYEDGKSSINPSKTELVWKRDFSKEAPVLVAEVKSNEWIGNVGDKKVVFSGKVKNINWYAGQVGWTKTMTMFINVEDFDGNIIVWKSSKSVDIQEGEAVMFEGTIVKHSEYRGKKQTIVNRCKRLL
jgi:hypothetical protein